MIDLNDLALFAAVVEHGSFSSAGRALGFPKSKVSRRIGDLEAQLGVRLLHRSTRVVSLTDAGSEFYKHCQSVTNAAKAAVDVAQRAAEGPIGKVRVSCPVGIAHLFLARILPQFLRSEPAVQLEFEITSPSRRGMVPAVRAFIEHLARTVPPTMKNPTGQYGCDPLPLAPERGSSGRQ